MSMATVIGLKVAFQGERANVRLLGWRARKLRGTGLAKAKKKRRSKKKREMWRGITLREGVWGFRTRRGRKSSKLKENGKGGRQLILRRQKPQRRGGSPRETFPNPRATRKVANTREKETALIVNVECLCIDLGGLSKRGKRGFGSF